MAASVCGSASLGPGLRADDNPAGDNPPGTRAIRLSSVDGEVHLSHGGEPLADQAVANTPLFEGTQVVTGNDGRAEIQFEDGSIARLSPASSLTLAVLRGQGGSGDAEIVLNGGLGYFELQGDSQSNHLRVRFGDSVVTAAGSTVLRVNLDKPPGELAVFSGNAHLDRGGNESIDLHGGESVAWDSSDPDHSKVAESIEPDSWDAWNSDRDQALSASSGDRTAASGSMPDSRNPAWGDLDANGTWYNVPDQGYVWSPYEASGSSWDPYGSGYWMSEPGYGYAWVSAEPWGYMPYQCGAWNYYNSFGWGWAPGLCRTWWGGGFGGGWAFNIGSLPPGYRFPRRPPTHPHSPRPLQPAGGTRYASLIAVNRRPLPGTTVLPLRDRTTPVSIAGTTVQPLRPLPSRPTYDRNTMAGANRPGSSFSQATGYQARPGYTRPPVGGNAAYYAARPAPRATGGGSYSRPSAPSHASSGGAPAAHSSGGGGGGSHGGGGGSHH